MRIKSDTDLTLYKQKCSDNCSFSLAVIHLFPKTSTLEQTIFDKHPGKIWKISINESMITERVEYIVEKVEIARNDQFLLSTLYFRKSFAAEESVRQLHLRIWERVVTLRVILCVENFI